MLFFCTTNWECWKKITFDINQPRILSYVFGNSVAHQGYSTLSREPFHCKKITTYFSHVEISNQVTFMLENKNKFKKMESEFHKMAFFRKRFPFDPLTKIIEKPQTKMVMVSQDKRQAHRSSYNSWNKLTPARTPMKSVGYFFASTDLAKWRIGSVYPHTTSRTGRVTNTSSFLKNTFSSQDKNVCSAFDFHLIPLTKVYNKKTRLNSSTAGGTVS